MLAPDSIDSLLWIVDQHFLGLAPAASELPQASRMDLAGFLIDHGALSADCGGGTVVRLMGRV